MIKKILEGVGKGVASLAILAGLLAITFFFGDYYVIEPDNAVMYLDYRNRVFVSPPCASRGAAESKVFGSINFDTSTMREVRQRRMDGEKWRPDDRCNAVDGFWQRVTFWNRVLGHESRWHPDGSWRW